MPVTAQQQRILTPFVGEACRCLKLMAGLEAKGGDAFEDAIPQFRFKGYAVGAKVKKGAKGTILMHLYPESVIEIGNRVLTHMLGEPSTETTLTTDVGEAVTEWGNTVIGVAMRGLEEAGIGIEFDPPYFIQDVSMVTELLKETVEIISVPIFTEGAGRFYFNYLLSTRTDQGAC